LSDEFEVKWIMCIRLEDWCGKRRKNTPLVWKELRSCFFCGLGSRCWKEPPPAKDIELGSWIPSGKGSMSSTKSNRKAMEVHLDQSLHYQLNDIAHRPNRHQQSILESENLAIMILTVGMVYIWSSEQSSIKKDI